MWAGLGGSPRESSLALHYNTTMSRRLAADAAWLGLVGPRAFGSVIETARVLMLVLHVAAVILLFVAARRLGVRPAAATLGALAFAASPLAVFYGREAILDNIMAFWLVLALALLAAARGARGMALAGAALGVAILSKEPALVLVPAYARSRGPRATRQGRRHALAITAPRSSDSLYPCTRSRRASSGRPAREQR